MIPVTHDDSLPSRLLKTGHPTAALEWLGRADGVIRTLGELTPVASLSLVQAFQNAGGVVFAVKVERSVRPGLHDDETRENTGHLVVQVPSEPSRRAKIFQLEAKQSKSVGYEPTRDFGQGLLHVKLD